MVHGTHDNLNGLASLYEPYDKPIPKPPSEALERFLESLESRFVTKRFPNKRITRRQHERNLGPGRGGLLHR